MRTQKDNRRGGSGARGGPAAYGTVALWRKNRGGPCLRDSPEGTQCRFDAFSAAYCGIGLVGIAFVACKMLRVGERLLPERAWIYGKFIDPRRMLCNTESL